MTNKEYQSISRITVSFVLLVVLAFVIPKVLPSGIHGLVGVEKEFATHALIKSYDLGGKAPRLIAGIGTMSVKDVKRVSESGTCQMHSPLGLKEIPGTYEATVIYHAFFGIPVFQTTIDCGWYYEHPEYTGSQYVLTQILE